jgi:hypothetical protein
MKKILLLFNISFITLSSFAQLTITPKCPEIEIDILDGIINKTLTPNSTVGQIKLNLPCFTSFEEEGTDAECGAEVFYKDKDVSFYPTRNYIEIGPAFKGNMTLPLIGAARDGLFKMLGYPMIKDVKWDAFQTAYGIIILYYDADSKVNKIQFTSESAKTIQLCEKTSDETK